MFFIDCLSDEGGGIADLGGFPGSGLRTKLAENSDLAKKDRKKFQ
jgi:hypothetical protein